MSYGMDNYYTGISQVRTGSIQNSSVVQLLEGARISPEVVSIADFGSGLLSGNLASLSKSGPKIGASLISQIRQSKAETYVNRASSFAGSKRGPLKNAPYQKFRNSDTIINGRTYSGHALNRLQDRGLMPSLVENSIATGQVSFGRAPGRLRNSDSVNKINTIVDEIGRVITIIPGRK